MNRALASPLISHDTGLHPRPSHRGLDERPADLAQQQRAWLRKVVAVPLAQQLEVAPTEAGLVRPEQAQERRDCRVPHGRRIQILGVLPIADEAARGIV